MEKRRKVTTETIRQMKHRNERFVCLTAYDALIARIFDEAGIDVLLVGDSLGNVLQGHPTTLPVTLDQMIYHTQMVKRGVQYAMVVADMPFLTYQISAEQALRNAGRLMKEAGAEAVKLEGGERIAETVRRLTETGIPVMGHLGLTPQSIYQFGTYRTRGVDPAEAERIRKDALILQEAGVFSIVLEKIPARLARQITESLDIPTIGIGAGPHCDAQILVYTDMLGLTIDFSPRFVRRYEHLYQRIADAVQRYIADVRQGDFPSDEESY